MDCVHFETLGCKLNQIETESLAHAFAESGFHVSHGHETAGGTPENEDNTAFRPVERINLCVVNTCTVTGKAEQKARRLIRLLLRNHPDAPVLVTGCYAEVESAAIAEMDSRVCVFPGSRKGELADLPSWLSFRQTRNPGESLLSALRDFCTRGTAATAPGPEGTFRLATDDFLFHSRASIKIQDGCDNRCAYCRIRLARGRSVSLDATEVIDRIGQIEDAGWDEVVLTGVNLSQYRTAGPAGKSGTGPVGDFADLLERILAETSHIAVRISSLYPERIDEAILPALSNPRIRPHFHLSVQSGSDRILALMHRPYTADTVYRAAERLRSIRENPFLACDIITGFPGETGEDFEMTLRMCTEIGFAWIHAFPFSPRPGTEAWGLKPRIPERIAGERVAALTALARENHRIYADYWTGRILPAIVEQESSGGPVPVLTENYLSARVDEPGLQRGKQIRVLMEGNGHARFVK